MHMTEANQVVEDEQPLVDLELLAHFEAQAEERIEREQDLDDDHEERAAMVCSYDEVPCDEDRDFVLLGRLFGYSEVA